MLQNNLQKNGSGYTDPTAYEAITNVEKECRELAEFSGGEYIKLENDIDVAQIILNTIEHGSVDLGKSYELDFSSEKNSQIIANEYELFTS